MGEWTLDAGQGAGGSPWERDCSQHVVAARGAREEVWTLYWFTGYIFDTFNEFTQMLSARKGAAGVRCPFSCAFQLCFPLRRREQATAGAPVVHGPQHPRPPSLPWAE